MIFQPFTKLRKLIPDADYKISIYASRGKQRSESRRIIFHTVPPLVPPTQFRVNHTRPDGALLLWDMKNSKYIDGYEMFIYNKEITHLSNSPQPIKMLHVNNTDSEKLITDLHWETKYRILLFAVRGDERTEKREVNFKTDIFVEPVFRCDVNMITDDSAELAFDHRVMKRRPKILFRTIIEDHHLEKYEEASYEEQELKVIHLRTLQ